MILGVDAGSKFLKISKQDDDGLQCLYYQEHHGAPEQTLRKLIETKGLAPEKIVFSGHYARNLSGEFENSCTVDEVSAVIEGLRYLEKDPQYIVNVGAASIKLIELDDDGDFSSYRENTLCAAGTGSFLDEQMSRMDFNYDKLKSLDFIEQAPDIATRCAVFAKSDLIHRQQEGYTREEMWSGLCRGVVKTMLQSVFSEQHESKQILFCGGIFLNPIVRNWLEQMAPGAAFSGEGHFLSSLGALVLNQNNMIPVETIVSQDNGAPDQADTDRSLTLTRSQYLDDPDCEVYYEQGNEVRLHTKCSGPMRALLGIDIGSTSTKLIALNPETHEALFDIYRKTEGNPLKATELLLKEVKRILVEADLEVTGIGTTGSGRKLVGEVIGADTIVNEITAHFRGASFFDSSIETIFEIGGQDSKYIRGYNGSAIDCNMNFVCAAGTGSFIEEQATRLGFDVREIGDLVLGLITPNTSDRCTVFMEQDINKLLREGYSREEVIAGVIRSIAKNYLNRVVGSRPVTGDKVFFQGATARNRGLVAAFETLLDKEVVVSPYCHVMGAFGAALIAGERVRDRGSVFRGFDVFSGEIKLDYTRCDSCSNNCKITIALVNGQEVSWGYMCGKESVDAKRPPQKRDHFRKVGNFLGVRPVPQGGTDIQSRGTIGIPRVLTMFNYAPLWETFFAELGFTTIFSKRSDLDLKMAAVQRSSSDFCFPMKLSLEHMVRLAENNELDAIFFPATISEKEQENGLPRVFCPYVISYPSVARMLLPEGIRFLEPAIDFRLDEKSIVHEIHASLKDLGVGIGEVRRAYRKGMESLKVFLKKRLDYGRGVLREIQKEKRTGIVIFGRPYNLYDRVLNLALTERLREGGIEVIPYETLVDTEEKRSDLLHMYWNYGEKILSVAEEISGLDNIYPVYFSNFSCGPDSFILTRFEEAMRGKPYLILELDEHGSETGYLTRIEAFLDVVLDKRRQKLEIKTEKRSFQPVLNNKKRTIWFPSMHDIGPRIFTAGFRAWGYDAHELPMEDVAAYEIGKQCIRGSECLPAATTIGVFLKKMRDINANPSEHALFMPTAEGPCRFGQYAMLHRTILDRQGYEDTLIFSPSSINSYLGMPADLHRYIWETVVCQDMLAKYIYKLRPYEVNPGEVDLVSEEVILDIIRVAENRGDLLSALVCGFERMKKIPVLSGKKPLVGIVGEIYVRCNHFCNNDLIRVIEQHGGEAWLTPISEWLIYTVWYEHYISRLRQRFNLKQRLHVGLKTKIVFDKLHHWEKTLAPYLHDRMEPEVQTVINRGKEFLPLLFEGEAILTAGRALLFLEQEADMVVNCSPFGCMPGNINNAIFKRIEGNYKKPIITLFYDGESDINRVIGIYLNNIKKAEKSEPPVAVGRV